VSYSNDHGPPPRQHVVLFHVLAGHDVKIFELEEKKAEAARA
jgi:hypothetical protein